jgi:hypothetical protein
VGGDKKNRQLSILDQNRRLKVAPMTTLFNKINGVTPPTTMDENTPVALGFRMRPGELLI